MGQINSVGNLVDDQDEIEPVVSFRWHEHEGDWVIVAYSKDAAVAIAAANGEEEAELICRSLNLVASDWASSDQFMKSLWVEYMRPSIND